MDAEGEGGTVGGDDAVSRLRTGDGEGTGQGVRAGSVWADGEEGSSLWIAFVLFCQEKHIQVLALWQCVRQIHPLLRSACVRGLWEVWVP